MWYKICMILDLMMTTYSTREVYQYFLRTPGHVYMFGAKHNFVTSYICNVYMCVNVFVC